MDLMALHIAFRGEHPIFYYGQDYMGAFEAYLGAALFRLIGTSVFVLRLGPLLLYTVSLSCLYFLAKLLYDTRVALFTVGLLALGSNDIITHELIAIGGYPESLCFGAIIFLLTSHLALTSSPSASSTPWSAQRRRVLLYALLGVVIGLALWSDLLILPCIAVAGLLLLVFCRHELLHWEGLALLAGSILGALPLLIYNLHPDSGYNSLVVLFQLHSIGASDVIAQHITPWQRLVSFIQTSLPTITGANPCHWLTDFTHRSATSYANTCSSVQSAWGMGVLVLWSIATFFTLVALRPCWQHIRHPQSPWDVGQRWQAIRQGARLMLLLSALLTTLQFVTSNAAALYPITASRYLFCLLLTSPALLWPLFRLRRPTQSASTDAGLLIIRLVLLTLIATTFLVGTLSTLSEIPAMNTTYRQQETLDSTLLHLGITRLYSEYWTCNRMIFQTREQIICASLNDTLGQGFNRYKPYLDMVRATPHPAYVFPLTSPQAQSFVHLHGNDPHYKRFTLVGYVIYQYVP